MADAFSIKFDSSGIERALDRLGDKARELTRPAAQAGAQVLYEEVRMRAPVSAESREYKGRTYTPGKLKSSIYQVFSENKSDAARSTYHISWNYKKARHGHLVEFGYWQRYKVIKTPAGWRVLKKNGKPVPLASPKYIPGHPFLRPAYAARKTAALQAAKTRFTQLMNEALSNLA